MFSISYGAALVAVSVLWIILRAYFRIRTGSIHILREFQLLLVYICIIVVMRFTFFAFGRVEGRIAPLVFDAYCAFPPRINLIPFVNLLDYPKFSEAMLNVIGNTTMFIPLGIIWPAVFKELNSHKKIIAAGVGFSLVIEILQLPFFDRVTDIDDLILNSVGYLLGYGIYLSVKKLREKISKARFSKGNT